jgi:hypothetical protein
MERRMSVSDLVLLLTYLTIIIGPALLDYVGIDESACDCYWCTKRTKEKK